MSKCNNGHIQKPNWYQHPEGGGGNFGQMNARDVPLERVSLSAFFGMPMGNNFSSFGMPVGPNFT